MTIARKTLVYESEVGVYHVVVRCVRRAFLCGADAYSRAKEEGTRCTQMDADGRVGAVAYLVKPNSSVSIRVHPWFCTLERRKTPKKEAYD